MSAEMQQLVVIAIVAAAALWLGWRLWKAISAREAGCDKCAPGTTPAGEERHQLGRAKPPR